MPDHVRQHGMMSFKDSSVGRYWYARNRRVCDRLYMKEYMEYDRNRRTHLMSWYSETVANRDMQKHIVHLPPLADIKEETA